MRKDLCFRKQRALFGDNPGLDAEQGMNLLDAESVEHAQAHQLENTWNELAVLDVRNPSARKKIIPALSFLGELVTAALDFADTEAQTQSYLAQFRAGPRS
jgi:hypothetical protein